MRLRRSSRSCCDLTRGGRLPSLRAKRSNPSVRLLRHGLLHFARNDVVRLSFIIKQPWRYASAFPRRDASELCEDSPSKQRERGMPGARCTRGLVRKLCERNAHEHTGSAETLRHSPRNGFTAYAVLSSV